MLKILPFVRSGQDRPTRIRPLVATVALVCTAVGAVVVIGFTTLALVPLLFAVGGGRRLVAGAAAARLGRHRRSGGT